MKETKRGLIPILILILFILLINILVYAEVNPVNEEQYQKVEDLTGKIPLDDSGNLDNEKLNASAFFIKSKTQERIDNINNWINENASWLGFFFRMVPEISFTFVLNIYIIILALTYFVFNSKRMFPFIEENTPNLLFGITVFLILLIANAYLYLSRVIVNIIYLFWNTVLPWGIGIAIVLFIVFSLIILVLLFFAPELLLLIIRWIARLFGKKVAKSATDSALNKAEEELSTIKKERKKIQQFNKYAYSQSA